MNASFYEKNIAWYYSDYFENGHNRAWGVGYDMV